MNVDETKIALRHFAPITLCTLLAVRNRPTRAQSVFSATHTYEDQLQNVGRAFRDGPFSTHGLAIKPKKSPFALQPGCPGAATKGAGPRRRRFFSDLKVVRANRTLPNRIGFVMFCVNSPRSLPVAPSRPAPHVPDPEISLRKSLVGPSTESGAASSLVTRRPHQRRELRSPPRATLSMTEGHSILIALPWWCLKNFQDDVPSP
jgi:hypothetical protein